MRPLHSLIESSACALLKVLVIFIGNLRRPINEVIPILKKKLSEAVGREVVLWFIEEKTNDIIKQVCMLSKLYIALDFFNVAFWMFDLCAHMFCQEFLPMNLLNRLYLLCFWPFFVAV